MPLIHENSNGVLVISVTPFTDTGEIDWSSLDTVTDAYLERGADGITILGMMGEAPKMTQSEALNIAKRVIGRAGNKPVVVGVSAPGLAAIEDLSKKVMDLGAAGVMVAPPGSLATDPQIYSYYGHVVRALGDDIPVVLQDFPLATKIHISIEVLNKIIADYPSIKMLKHEDWPGLAKITALRQAESDGQRRISILCGNGGSFLVEEMARGADGAMTGFCYPEMMIDIVRLMNEGNTARARDLFDAYLPLIRYESQPGLGLAMRKYVLAKRGLIKTAKLRRPGGGLDQSAAAEVDILMDRLAQRLKELA